MNKGDDGQAYNGNGAMKIGVVGAGNIGSAMAALLSQSEAEVTLTARGKRLETIIKDGVQLNERGKVICARPHACNVLLAPMDALFICVKSQSLPAAIKQNSAAITPETLVIPMINGLPFWFYANSANIGHVPHLDPDGILSDLLLPQQVLGAVILMTMRMNEQGQVHSTNTPTLSLGAVANGADPPKIDKLIKTLENGGIKADLSDQIRHKVLVKLLANFATNPLSALCGAMLNEIGQTAQYRDIAIALAREFRSWARIEGYEMPTDKWLVDLMVDAGAFPTSMLQDALADRPLELDAICYAPMTLAAQKGRDMPTLRALLTHIKNSDLMPLPKGKFTEVWDPLV